MEDSKFHEIFVKLAGSHTVIPSEILLQVLGGIVKTSEKDRPEIKQFAETMKDLPIEEVVSRVTLLTCNSVILSLWNIFGTQIEEAYKKSQEQSNKA